MDKRLDSLDALRGFDMFFITGGSALLAALGTLITGDAHSWIAVQMTHATWTEPLRIYDFIFPSCSSRASRSPSPRRSASRAATASAPSPSTSSGAR